MNRIDRFNNYTKKKELTAEDIKYDLYLSKFAIRVFFTEFALDWQCKNEDNFSNQDLNKCKKLFENLGYIFTGLYSELSETVRECLYLTNPNIDRIDKLNPICYIRTKTFKSDGYIWLINDILSHWKNNESVILFYEKLAKKHKSMQQIKKTINQQEKELYYRLIRHPSGLNYEKPTNKLRERNIALMQSRAKIEGDNSLALVSNKTELVSYYEQQERTKKRNIISGIDLSKLSSDYQQQNKEVSVPKNYNPNILKEDFNLNKHKKEMEEETYGTSSFLAPEQYDYEVREREQRKCESFLEELELELK